MGAIAEDVFKSGSLTAQDAVLELANPGTATVMVQLTGTFTATVVFEVNVDQGASPTWVAVNAQNVNTGAQVSSSTGTGIFRVDVSGSREFRIRCSAYTSGTIVATMNGSVASAAPGLASGSGGGSVVDTELPAAAAGADNVATAGVILPGVFAYQEVFDATAAEYNRVRAAGSIPDGASLGATAAYAPWLYNGATFDRWRTEASPYPTGTARVTAGGYTKVVSATLTRPANTTAYASGDEVTDTGGGILTVTSAARASGLSGIIHSVAASFSSNWATKPTLELWIFDTTSTPQSDNAAFAPSDGVVDTLVGIIPLSATYVGDATASTGNFAMDSGYVGIPFQTSGSANLFCRLVVRNAAQAGANSDTIKLRFRILQD